MCSNSGRGQARAGSGTSAGSESNIEQLKQEIWKTRFDIRKNESAMQVARRNIDISYRFSRGEETDRIKNDKRTLDDLMKLQRTLNRRLANQTRRFDRMSSE